MTMSKMGYLVKFKLAKLVFSVLGYTKPRFLFDS